MGWLKRSLTDFPTHPATVAGAIFVFLAFGVNVNVRFARGLDMPSGYDNFMWMLLAALGIGGATLVGKRLSDVAYKEAGNKGPPPPTNVTVEAPSKVEVKP